MAVSLPMYDLPEVAADTAALAAAISRRVGGIGGAVGPARHDLPAQWRAHDLVLSQTCGLPLVGYLSDVHVVGLFTHAGFGGRYRSVIVAPARRRPGPATIAVNDHWSLSGWLSLLAVEAEHGPYAPRPQLTGSHRASVAAVRTGIADLASIDAVTWELLHRHAPDDLDGVEVVGHGPEVPELPLITADGSRVRALREALVDLVADPALAPQRERLLVDGFVPCDRHHYDGVVRLVRRHLGDRPSPAPPR